MKILDFDSIFAGYLNEWYAKKKAQGFSYAELEEAAGNLYHEWADMPLPEAGGISARAYFDNIREPREIITLLIKYAAADISAPDLLAERIANDPECGKFLFEIARIGESAELAAFAVNILHRNGYPGLNGLLIDWLIDDRGGEYARIAVELLIENVKAAAPEILSRLDKGGLPEPAEKNLADVLVYAGKDDRIFKLLLRLFREDEDTALYASYLAKYGDERALPVLIEYGRRGDINYIQFMETRNAVEALGGVLENGKDFSEDEYFHAIKEVEEQ